MTVQRLLAAQDGLMHRSQARDAGVGRRSLDHRLRTDGPWRLVLPEVIAGFTGSLSEEQRWRAALLYAERGTPHCAGDLVLLAAGTALRAYAFDSLPDQQSASVQLLLKHDHKRCCRARGAISVRVKRTTRMPEPRWRGGLPVAPVERAVVDACRQLRSLPEVRELVAQAVQTRRTTVGRLAAELAAGESAGSMLVRRALEEVGLGARSAAEAGMLSDIRRSDLPPARWNCVLHATNGLWLANPDAWWPEANTALEIDSVRWHLSPARWADTMARHERMTRHGLLVVHFSPTQYAQDAAGCRRRLAETIAYGRRMPRAPVVAAAAA
jgi:hypothetical protein